jgi:phytoene dehydrogenase-like protein
MKYCDDLIIGGGHNGLIAAAYLAKAGRRVLLIEANDEVGGATTSAQVFPSYQARLSRYSYLVSLLPEKIVSDLGLSFETLSRRVSSYTPYAIGGRQDGLFVARRWCDRTHDSFVRLTGSDREAIAWRRFYGLVLEFAQKVAPTLLEPLPTREQLSQLVSNPEVWKLLVEEPLGYGLDRFFENDLVKGVVLTDGVIGTFTSAYDLQANICFLYHLIGGGTGEWRVPKGGMGALVSELVRSARGFGAEIQARSKAVSLEIVSGGVVTGLANGTEIKSQFVLANLAPQHLSKMLGREPSAMRPGSQIKINLLLKNLPQFRSGIDPRDAFAGTLHINQSFSALERSYHEAARGILPSELPLEMYCHTLTDGSIMSSELQETGYHTLTLFGLHLPADLFVEDESELKRVVLERAIEALNRYLVEPIETCLAHEKSVHGLDLPCIEVKSPLDLEREIALPRGNIFHKDLSFPFRTNPSQGRWGVETDEPHVLLAGAGAIRGGGVSGIPGHNAAKAVLEMVA